MTEQAPDIFGGGEGGGAPSIGQKYVRPGDSYSGILLPAGGDGSMSDPAYITTQQTSMADGEKLFWDDGKPRWQGEITFITDFRNYELMSDNMIAKLKEEGTPDNGVRRQFIKGSTKQDGASLKEFKEAFQKAGANRPEIGATFTHTFVKKVPAGAGKEAWFHKWEYARPTEATLAKVKSFLAEQDKESADILGDDEPPF